MADEGLNTPGRDRRWAPKVRVDSDTFGQFAESFARFMGTARFLIWMTAFIIVWIALNTVGEHGLLNDAFPFIFLTLLLSLQASYAAPLILLAQNRQEARDKVAVAEDRRTAAQSRADMDFLAREIASLRMRVNDLATRDFVRSELRDLLEELDSRSGEDKPQE